MTGARCGEPSYGSNATVLCRSAHTAPRGSARAAARGMGGGARLLATVLVAACLGAVAAQQLPQGTYPLADPALYAPLQLVGAPTGATPD